MNIIVYDKNEFLIIIAIEVAFFYWVIFKRSIPNLKKIALQPVSILQKIPW